MCVCVCDIPLLYRDNGGAIQCPESTCGDFAGSSNYPLRGGKHSLWEGGVRLTAAVAGPMLDPASIGSNVTGLMHHTDWLPTLLEAARVRPVSICVFRITW